MQVNELGFIETTIDFALDCGDLAEDVKKLIIEKANQLQKEQL